MLRSECLCYPDHRAGTDTGGVCEDLTEVPMISFGQLIFDDDLPIAVRAKDIELEVTNPMFRGDEFKLTQLQRFRQSIEVLLLRKPWRKVTSFVLPGFP